MYQGIPFVELNFGPFQHIFCNSLVYGQNPRHYLEYSFQAVSTDLHLLFRYFRTSKFLARALTGNTN
jgi:hypothetical protein